MYFKKSDSVKNNSSYTRKYQDHIPCGFTYIVVCIDNKFSKKIVLYGGKNVVYEFIKAILGEYSYCKKVTRKHFNKNLVMSAEEEERSQLSNICWICNRLFDVGDEKVRDHCYVTGKYKGSAHWSCNVNLKMSKKVPVIFHDLRDYDSHLIIEGLNKFDVKVSVIPNGLEKYMAFTINRNIVFINSKQVMNSLVRNLMDEDFKYLSEEYNGECLRLVKQKGVYPYQYMNSFKKFSENKLPDKCQVFSSLKDKCISEKDYQRAKIIWNTFKMN